MASELEWLNKMNISAADNDDLRTIPVTKEISVQHLIDRTKAIF